MAKSVRLLVGTKKGLFILEGGGARRDWDVRGPFCEAWPINHAVGDPATGRVHAGGGNEWFGPAVWTTPDLGETWSHSSAGLAYAGGEEPIRDVWSLAAGHGALYAGVCPAGLFRSEDGGENWEHVAGLREHPTRPDWQPGGAGLILHSILLDPGDAAQAWVGMSAVGVFHTADGGATWEPRNAGTRNDYLPDQYPEFGQCVHSIAMAPGVAGRLYQQNHCGMYRSEDGAKTWTSIEAGLPSTFGFPAAAHPRDPDTLYLFPLNGDQAGRYAPDGKAAVWRTCDGGGSWQDLRAGLPEQNAYLTVLRQAMAADSLDPAGVYFGTTSGSVFASADEGETWACIARHLPLITSVETFVTED